MRGEYHAPPFLFRGVSMKEILDCIKEIRRLVSGSDDLSTKVEAQLVILEKAIRRVFGC